MLDERIQKAGAEARARGESMFDNPYLRPEAMPKITGEGIAEWSAKHDAWELGWRAEDLMRG
jgi:hypothetical protein